MFFLLECVCAVFLSYFAMAFPPEDSPFTTSVMVYQQPSARSQVNRLASKPKTLQETRGFMESWRKGLQRDKTLMPGGFWFLLLTPTWWLPTRFFKAWCSTLRRPLIWSYMLHAYYWDIVTLLEINTLIDLLICQWYDGIRYFYIQRHWDAILRQ